jgi:hypothetical protein
MRSAPETDILKACLRAMVENDPLITLEKAKATIVATRCVSVTQQLIGKVLKTLRFSRNKKS